MKRNKIFRVVLIFICLLLVLSQLLIIFASSDTSIAPIGEVMLSVYNDSNNEYIVENTRLDIPSDTTMLTLMSLAKKEKLIKSYAILDQNIASITDTDDTVFKAQTSNLYFMVRINGYAITKGQMTDKLNPGDIVEIIFSKESVPVVAIPSSETVEPPIEPENAIKWDSDLAKMQSAGFDWLNRNLNSSSSYLIAAGVIEKTADVKLVSTLVNSINQTKEYSDATDLAKDVLGLTFCGFDASSEKYHRLVQKLYNFKDIMCQGILDAVNALIAYDCNNYDISENAINSRDTLVSAILKFQNADGGFPASLGASSDVDTTALTLTALSSYQSNDDVSASIDKSLSYLSEIQTDTGGFQYDNEENLESLCSVVIALSSLKIPLNDERFEKDELTLLDNMIQYCNSDGGFGYAIGEKSSATPTEQALIALSSIKRGSNPYILLKSIEIDKSVAQEDNVSPITEDNSTITVIIGAVLGVISIAAIVYIIKTKEKRKTK